MTYWLKDCISLKCFEVCLMNVNRSINIPNVRIVWRRFEILSYVDKQGVKIFCWFTPVVDEIFCIDMFDKIQYNMLSG
uniref:Uncharacterized protein n=1 Tax=Romanomermis culicivorax TaxID=13658 RepID=A0A915JXV9_ROMCU